MRRIRLSAPLVLLFCVAWPLVGTAGELVKPSDPRFQYMGRIDFSDPEAPAFDWAGVNIQAAIKGSKACFLVEDAAGQNYYNLTVDGKPFKVVAAKPGPNRFEVSGLRGGNHTVVLSKRTEGFQGIAVFKGLELGDGTSLLSLPDPSQRKIEFIGASWVNGYGNEGVTYGKCDNLQAVSNADLSFTVVLAKNLGAQYHVTAVSGRGIIRWYGDTKPRSDDTMPKDFTRVLFNRPDSKWDFAAWIPDAVVINLGLNDYSSEPHPDDREFIQGYTAFLERVRGCYPEAEIFCIADEGWPGYKDKVLEAIRTVVDKGDKRIHFIGYPGFETKDLGCDWHPNTKADRVLAGLLEPVMRKTLDWK